MNPPTTQPLAPPPVNRPPQAAPRPSGQRASPGARLAAFVCALFVLGAVAVSLYFIQSARITTENIAKTFQPQIQFKTVLSGAIGKLNDQPKLIVLTADVTAKVIQENTTTFAGINVGTAKVEVSAPSIVQYYVPMDHLKADDFFFDAANKRLVMTIDRPMLDQDVVSVESNPDKIDVRTELGWRPLSVFKGTFARDEARRHLKEAALAQGDHTLLHEHAEKNAKEVIAKQLNTVFQALGEGVKFEVEFKK